MKLTKQEAPLLFTRFLIRFASCLFIPALLLTACMVGPDFHQPRAPNIPTFIEGHVLKKTVGTKSAGAGGKVQSFSIKESIPSDWWHLFHSQTLNNLVATGLANSPN
jgi:outer membrane protein TolC